MACVSLTKKTKNKKKVRVEEDSLKFVSFQLLFLFFVVVFLGGVGVGGCFFVCFFVVVVVAVVCCLSLHQVSSLCMYNCEFKAVYLNALTSAPHHTEWEMSRFSAKACVHSRPASKKRRPERNTHAACSGFHC